MRALLAADCSTAARLRPPRASVARPAPARSSWSGQVARVDDVRPASGRDRGRLHDDGSSTLGGVDRRSPPADCSTVAVSTAARAPGRRCAGRRCAPARSRRSARRPSSPATRSGTTSGCAFSTRSRTLPRSAPACSACGRRRGYRCRLHVGCLDDALWFTHRLRSSFANGPRPQRCSALTPPTPLLPGSDGRGGFHAAQLDSLLPAPRGEGPGMRGHRIRPHPTPARRITTSTTTAPATSQRTALTRDLISATSAARSVTICRVIASCALFGVRSTLSARPGSARAGPPHRPPRRLAMARRSRAVRARESRGRAVEESRRMGSLLDFSTSRLLASSFIRRSRPDPPGSW